DLVARDLHLPHVHHVGEVGGGGPVHVAVVPELDPGGAGERPADHVEPAARVGAVEVLRVHERGALQRLVRISGDERGAGGGEAAVDGPVVAAHGGDVAERAVQHRHALGQLLRGGGDRRAYRVPHPGPPRRGRGQLVGRHGGHPERG